MSAIEAMQQADSLSRQILSAADKQDWRDVGRLETRWSDFIHGCFSGSHCVSREQAIELKRLNDEIVQCLARHRQAVTDRRSQLNHGNKASKAYRDTANR